MHLETTTSPAASGTGSPADSATIRVLIVEGDESEAHALSCALAADPLSSFAVTTANTLSACLQSQVAFDVILLDGQLPDVTGVEAIRSVAAAFPDAHLCVMTSEEEAGFGTTLLRAGADDYVLKRDVRTPLLGPFLRTKVQRFHAQMKHRKARQAESGLREMRSLDAMSDRPGTRVSSRHYGGQSLRESARTEFERLAETYEKLLALAIETRVYKDAGGGATTDGALVGLSHALGRLDAGPRDVVEIHTAAIRSMTSKAGADRSRIILEEARILVLGLMGHLVTYYRSHSLGQPVTGD